MVKESRKCGKFLPSLNATFPMLIPKKGVTHEASNFRLIALCNVIYKIISKTISNRLKPLLPYLISNTQHMIC